MEQVPIAQQAFSDVCEKQYLSLLTSGQSSEGIGHFKNIIQKMEEKIEAEYARGIKKLQKLLNKKEEAQNEMPLVFKSSKKLEISQKFRANFFAIRTLFAIIRDGLDVKYALSNASCIEDLLEHTHSFILDNIKISNLDSKDLQILLKTVLNLSKTPLSQQEIKNNEFFNLCKKTFFKFVNPKKNFGDFLEIQSTEKKNRLSKWTKLFPMGLITITQLQYDDLGWFDVNRNSLPYSLNLNANGGVVLNFGGNNAGEEVIQKIKKYGKQTT